MKKILLVLRLEVPTLTPSMVRMLDHLGAVELTHHVFMVSCDDSSETLFECFTHVLSARDQMVVCDVSGFHVKVCKELQVRLKSLLDGGPAEISGTPSAPS